MMTIPSWNFCPKRSVASLHSATPGIERISFTKHHAKPNNNVRTGVEHAGTLCLHCESMHAVTTWHAMPACQGNHAKRVSRAADEDFSNFNFSPRVHKVIYIYIYTHSLSIYTLYSIKK